MSVVATIAGVLLVLFSKDAATVETGKYLLTVVLTYWFLSSGINTVVHKVQATNPTTPTTDSTPTPTPTTSESKPS
jgi:uncharacterized membrane protein HdeD (DUF308 family)